MIPPRLPPSGHPLPIPSTADERPSPGNAAAANSVPKSGVSPTAQAQAWQPPPPGTVTGSSTASGRKRQIPPPSTPSATRLRTDAGALQATFATSPWSHAALQQQAQITQAIHAINAALSHFRMDWTTLDEQQQHYLFTAATRLPSAPCLPGMTETAIRQQQLHAVLTAMQTAQAMMTWLSRQRQQGPQVIKLPPSCGFAPAVYYGGVTIDGPHLDHAGRSYFYLEQQHRRACAQHAVNAMVGGPLVLLEDFAQWEAKAQASTGATPTPVKDMVARMRAQGVRSNIVNDTLQGLGIPTHSYVYQPIIHAQRLPVLDRKQACFLDELDTDRLLLQADRYEGDSAAPDYVAFRRDAGQWVLLDSSHKEPQDGVTPSRYLLSDASIQHFTAIWPQHALRGRGTPLDGEGMIQEFLDEPAGAAQRGMPQLSPSLIDDMIQELLDEPAGAAQDAMPAPSASENDAMKESASKGAGHRGKRPMDELIYDFADAKSYWNGKRAEEFDSLQKEWNQKTGQDERGANFLIHLSVLCRDAGEGKPVEEDARIREFEVKMYREAKETVRLWRRVGDNKKINLRLAPPEGDSKARTALLKSMQKFENNSAGYRWRPNRERW